MLGRQYIYLSGEYWILKDKFDQWPKLSVSSRRSMLNILAPFTIIYHISYICTRVLIYQITYHLQSINIYNQVIIFSILFGHNQGCGYFIWIYILSDNFLALASFFILSGQQVYPHLLIYWHIDIFCDKTSHSMDWLSPAKLF